MEKMIPKRLSNKGVKKPRIKFNPVLALIGLRTTGPRWWINKHNQNYNNTFEHDWLSPVRFEHYQDSVRVMLVIEQCAGTI